MAQEQHRKIREDDEGQLAVICYIKNGHVIIDFGKSLSWVALHKDGLRDLIDKLEEKYKQL